MDESHEIKTAFEAVRDSNFEKLAALIGKLPLGANTVNGEGRSITIINCYC